MLSTGRAGWRRAGFELVIVFLGVLVALLVDGWNEGRIERAVERDYLQRILEDVREDRRELSALTKALDSKRDAIVRLLSPTHFESMSDLELLQTLVEASTAGFGVLSGNSTTFEDLRGTGNLGLVSDPELRAEIVSYYESWRFNAERVEARRSSLPPDVYALLPSSAFSTDVFFDAPADSVPSNFSRSAVVAFLGSQSGRSELRGESNYARFFRGVVRDLDEQAEQLSNAVRPGSD